MAKQNGSRDEGGSGPRTIHKPRGVLGLTNSGT